MSVPANGEERVLVTAQGYERLSRDLDRLRNDERRRLARLLRDARADGDLDDNPALVDLLDEQARLERRIATLEAQLTVAEVAPPARDGRAAIGSVVRVRDLARGAVFDYALVGRWRAIRRTAASRSRRRSVARWSASAGASGLTW